MIRARLTLSVPDEGVAESLVQAVEPDNLKMDRLTVTGSSNDQSATFVLAYEGKIETFIFTLDDLLQCLQAAKDILQSMTKRRSTSVKGN